MRLLVFAHKKEAESFIDHLNFIPQINSKLDLYKNDSDYLLITNEGINEALLNTSIFLASNLTNIDLIINIGVAGSINSKIKVGDIVQVKTVYGKNCDTFEYQSFPTNKPDAKTECLSVSTRIYSKDEKLKLSPIADIIDRESWGIAYVSKKFKIDFYSIKYISDDLDSTDFCHKVMNESELLSKRLLHFYQTEFAEVSEIKIEDKIDISFFTQSDFLYFSVSQERQLINILRLLKLQNFNLQDFISSSDFKSIIESELRPKEKSKLLLSILYSLSNPVLAQTKKKIDKIVSKFQTNSILFKIDPALANRELNILLSIANKNSLDIIISDLANFNHSGVEEYFDLLDGKL